MVFDPAPFKSWLVSKNYSEATIRNYLTDLNRYFDYVKHLPEAISYDITQSSEIHILSPSTVQKYVTHLTGQKNAPRYLASLNLFCQFAVDQQLLAANPFKTINRTPAKPGISGYVDRFGDYLLAHHTAQVTIRNYINDLNQYINWLNGPQKSN